MRGLQPWEDTPEGPKNKPTREQSPISAFSLSHRAFSRDVDDPITLSDSQMRWAIMGTMKSASLIVPLLRSTDGRRFFFHSRRFVSSKRDGGDLRKGSDGAHAVLEVGLGLELRNAPEINKDTACRKYGVLFCP